jgi:hypothetical protein
MMVTGAGSFRAARSLALPHDLSGDTDEYPVFGPFDWTHEVQLRIARLLASQSREPTEPTSEPISESASERSASAQAATNLADGEESVAAARLEGIQLAAREIAHLVNNDLAVTVGTLDLLRARGDVPASVLELLDQALAGLSAATGHVEQLQRVQRVVTRQTPAGPSLDLDRSL